MSAVSRRRMSIVAVVVVVLLAALLLAGCRSTVPQLIGMRQADAVRAIEEAGYKLGNVAVVATDRVSVGLVADQSPAYGEKLKKGEPIDVSVNFNNGSEAIVPTVTGLEEQTAVTVAETTKLVPLVTDQYSDVVAEGLCADQSPSPGSKVKTGDTLVIVMSKGKAPEKAKVPDVAGKSQADAESAIRNAGFTPETSKVYYDSVAKGKVITQQPGGGKSATVGSKVQIVVSLGKGTGSATVPSVKGKSESDATKAISNAGLKAKVLKQYSESVAKGKVIDQFPASGAKAAAGSEVLIAVSLGKEPSGSVAVPDIMGMSEADAVSAIEAAGLVAQVQGLASEAVPAGTVGYQFPAAGTQAAPGSEVLVAVSLGAAPQ